MAKFWAENKKNGSTCSNFFLTNNPSYGNCFTFNSGLSSNGTSSSNDRVSSMSGPTFGLELVFNLHQQTYMKQGQTRAVKTDALRQCHHETLSYII